MMKNLKKWIGLLLMKRWSIDMGDSDRVILITNSQKDGVSRKKMSRKEAEKIIKQNDEWKYQFNIEEIK